MRRLGVAGATVAYDETDPEGFRSGYTRPGPELGARRTGATVYELPPGQAICPYHYEHAEEEWLLVLSGRPTLRDPDGEHRLEPHDLVFFPTGPKGAHGVAQRDRRDGARAHVLRRRVARGERVSRLRQGRRLPRGPLREPHRAALGGGRLLARRDLGWAGPRPKGAFVRARLRRPSPALVIACLALVVAMTGTTWAVTTLPAGSVGSTQLRTGAVTNSKLGSRAVSTRSSRPTR